MGGITIRSDFRPGDIGYITYLHGILYAKEHGWDHTFEAYVAGPLAEFALRRGDRERIWICELEGKVAGSLALVQHTETEAQLRWLLLHPELRGRGLGRRLMAELLVFAREAGYASIFLWTTADLGAARELYRKAGFTKTEEVSHEVWGRHLTEERYELVLQGSPRTSSR